MLVPPGPEPVRLALRAMATRFEAVLHGRDPASVRAAGEEAMAEIARIEDQLSFYRESSQLSRMNRAAGVGAFRADPVLFELLTTCRRLHDATGGAFDPAVGPLMRVWGFTGQVPVMPTEEALGAAHARSGFAQVRLDSESRSVQFLSDGLELDFGAIGKGFALDEAAALLRDAGISSGLLHGGTSTAIGLGHQADGAPWVIAVPTPEAEPDAAHEILAEVNVSDRALSVSAVAGKYLDFDGSRYGHVLDPRTGRPTRSAMLAAVAGPTATETDAFSTALLVLGPDAALQLPAFRRRDLSWLVVVNPAEVHTFQMPIRAHDSVVCLVHEPTDL